MRRLFYIWPVVNRFQGFVLSLGCGQALDLQMYRGLKLGVDLSEANVRDCISRGIPAICGDACDFVRPETYDTVLLSHVLEHVSEPWKVLQNAFESLRPGGRLIIITPLTFHWGNHNFLPTEEYLDQFLLSRDCKKILSYAFPPFYIPYFERYRELRLMYLR